MKPEKIAVILETASFFLVTLDLFGKERLKSLYERLQLFLSKLKSQQFKIDVWILSNGKRALTFAVLSAVFAGISIWQLVKWIKDEDLIPENTFYLAIGFFIFQITIGFGSILIVNLIGFLINRFVSLTLGLLVKVLYRYHLEGIMLAVGTVLFLISKLISFSN